MTDKVIEPRSLSYEKEITELKSKHQAELTTFTAEYKDRIAQMQSLHQEEISNMKIELDCTNRRIKGCVHANEIYEAQIQMVRMLCGYAERKEK